MGGQSQPQPPLEIVRQQWTFSPPGTTREVEDYRANLAGVGVLELAIRPDLGSADAIASLESLIVPAPQPASWLLPALGTTSEWPYPEGDDQLESRPVRLYSQAVGRLSFRDFNQFRAIMNQPDFTKSATAYLARKVGVERDYVNAAEKL